MILFIHKIASWYIKRRLDYIENFMRHPLEVQEAVLQNLIWKARNTAFGKKHGFVNIGDANSFRQRVPISSYEEFFPWIERSFKGESDVLWPGTTTWFAKSSGTTNDRSKFLPVTDEFLQEGNFQVGQDMLAAYLDQHEESKLFTGKSLSIGGSHTVNQLWEGSRYGDISAVMMENLPFFYEFFRTPSKKVALMENWEDKLDAMAEEVMNEDVTGLVGVPTWTLVLINRIFEKKGIEDRDLRRIWPNLELFCHGGVNFEPYREQFGAMVQNPKMNYVDCYNASEGFFGIQNDLGSDDLLLMLDYGIFYEFIPMEELGREQPQTHTLAEVEAGRNYAMVISTNAGLWRYLIGDTVTFTSINPFKIRITGRTKHFINAFGEELMVDNAELAISRASRKTGAVISDYTAAPIYLNGTDKGGHEWLVEFDVEPADADEFVRILDTELRRINSDYDAKRQADLALLPPVIHHLPRGSFHTWLASRGKLGGQNKVPRLSNDRGFLEEILEMIAVKQAND